MTCFESVATLLPDPVECKQLSSGLCGQFLIFIFLRYRGSIVCDRVFAAVAETERICGEIR